MLFYVWHKHPEEPFHIHSARITRYWYHRRRNKCLEILGNKCVRCGITDKRVLQIDHINGVKGKREHHHDRFKRIIAGDIADFQLLCANCNMIKKHEKREYPNIKYDKEILKDEEWRIKKESK